MKCYILFNQIWTPFIGRNFFANYVWLKLTCRTKSHLYYFSIISFLEGYGPYSFEWTWIAF